MKDDILVSGEESIKEALKKLDKSAKKVLLVTDGVMKLIGTLTDGDIRRHMLSGRSLDSTISGVYNRKPVSLAKDNFSPEAAKELFLKHKVELLPIVDSNGIVIDFITWDRLFSKGEVSPIRNACIDIPVVIMAGGKGARLEPFTRVLPKPLIPIGDKPIIEIIIDEFRKQGARRFYITLNHKADMVEAYFNSIEKDYEAIYVREDDYLGTAGSLKLLEGRLKGPFIVTNCDVMVKANFEEVLNFHKESRAHMTVLSSIQHYKIPYGVIKSREGGEITEVLEKPEYTFTVNAGVYIIESTALKYISKDKRFDMTDLIKRFLSGGDKVVMYPVNEKDYIDIGQWEEYKKSLERMRILA